MRVGLQPFGKNGEADREKTARQLIAGACWHTVLQSSSIPSMLSHAPSGCRTAHLYCECTTQAPQGAVCAPKTGYRRTELHIYADRAHIPSSRPLEVDRSAHERRSTHLGTLTMDYVSLSGKHDQSGQQTTKWALYLVRWCVCSIHSFSRGVYTSIMSEGLRHTPGPLASPSLARSTVCIAWAMEGCMVTVRPW